MSLPRRPHAVIFDMDGLLVDTETVYRDAMIGTAQDLGRDMPPELFLKLIGLPWIQNIHLLEAHFGPGFDADAFRIASHERFHELAAVELSLKVGVVEILDRLDELGLPRAIATSSRHEDVEHHMGAHGLRHRFDTVVASGDYARGKPNPDPYLTAAERLGIAPELCLALEDSHAGVRAAASAGMMTIMVPDLLDPTEEMRTLCVRIARDLHEVRDLLGA